MIVSYPNAVNNIPRFTTLNKAILSGDNLEEINQYYGSDTSLLDLDDFNEYGWEFLVKKYRYNSFCPLNLLTLRDKTEVIGFNSVDIENVGKSFFPTLVEDDVDSSLIQYFGTLSVGRQKLTMIRIPPRYNLIDIYDTTDESPLKIKVEFNETESKFYRILWFVLTPGEKKNLVDINLSYISWEISNNPFRNQDKYLLREDDKDSIIHGIDVVENTGTESNPHWLDQSSGTLVGNRAVTDTPILDVIKRYFENDDTWDRYVSYKRGQTCTYSGETWISLENNNINNNPRLSNLWSLEELFSKDFTVSRAIITTVNLDGDSKEDYGEVTPTTIITTSSIEEYELTIYCRNGYVPQVIKNMQTENKIELSDEDGTSNYFWQAYTTGDGYFKVIVPASFIENASEIRIEYVRPYFECLSFIEDSSGNRIPKGYDVKKIGDEFTYRFNSGSGTVIKEIIVDYVIGDDTIVKSETIPVEETTSIYTVKKTIDYPAEYWFTCKYENTDSIIFNVLEHKGFFVDNMTKKVPLDFTGDTIITFYPEDDNFDGYSLQIQEVGGDWSTSLPNGVSVNYVTGKCYQLIFSNIRKNYNIKFNKNEN